MSKDGLDRFYTNDDVVNFILNKIDINKYDLIIEPSAGAGAFSKKINCLAFDLEPADPSIIKQDFLSYEYNGNIPREKILCIGNPPYGRQCSLAIKFIKKCSTFADTIGFVLPLSFKKDSIKNKIPQTYHLELELELDANSFTLNNNPYSVPCVFQLWSNLYQDRLPIMKIDPIGFEYTKKENAMFAIRRVGVYAGKAYLDINKSSQSHYFIKAKENVEKIVENLNNYHWEHDNTVGPRSISKPELNKVLNPIIQRYDERKN